MPDIHPTLTGAGWPTEFICAQSAQTFAESCLCLTLKRCAYFHFQSILNPPPSSRWCSDAVEFHCSLSPPLYRIAVSERGGCVCVCVSLGCIHCAGKIQVRHPLVGAHRSLGQRRQSLLLEVTAAGKGLNLPFLLKIANVLSDVYHLRQKICLHPHQRYHKASKRASARCFNHANALNYGI